MAKTAAGTRQMISSTASILANKGRLSAINSILKLACSELPGRIKNQFSRYLLPQPGGNYGRGRGNGGGAGRQVMGITGNKIRLVVVNKIERRSACIFTKTPAQ